MKKIIPLLTVLPLLILSPLGCKPSEEKKEEIKETPYSSVQEKTPEVKKIVARVNNNPIYEEDLMGRPIKDALENETLYQIGLKRGLDKEFEDKIIFFKKGLILEEVTKGIVKNLSREITNKEIQDYYNENESKYTNFKIKKIVVKDKNIAEKIHNRAVEGELLHEIAPDYSVSVAKVNIKGLPTVNKYKDHFNEFEEGSVSDIIETKDRFEIYKIEEKNMLPLSRVYNSIRYRLLEKRRKEAIQEFSEKLKEENKIDGEIEEILYQEGIKRGLDKKVQDQVEGYKKSLIVNEVNREILKNLNKEITDKEIEDFYKENESLYRYFLVKKITVKDRNSAEEIHKRASKGEDLEKIASDHSLKVANVSIRDLRFENKYKNLFKGKDVGSVIDIIETDKGFEILKIVDKTKVPVFRSKHLLKFNILKNRRSNAIDNLRDKNQITVEIVENKEGS